MHDWKLRIPKTLHRELRILAACDGQSLNAWATQMFYRAAANAYGRGVTRDRNAGETETGEPARPDSTTGDRDD
jgi:hypothetical protein